MAGHRFVAGVEGSELSRPQKARLTGAFIGAAVADALGAPFEFRTPGLWSSTFPRPVTGGAGEMVGGGVFGWLPGEATDDTQMAVALAHSLVESGGGRIDLDGLWAHFRAWVAGAKDVGLNTASVLAQESRHDAARLVHERQGRSASNGSVMRIAPVAIAGVRLGAEGTVELAIEQSRLTHHDMAAAVGAALVAEVARRCILGADFEEAIDGAFLAVREHGGAEAVVELEEFATLLDPTFDPRISLEHGNGSVWGAVCQAVWGVRHATNFHDAVTRVIDLGGDTDTVAAIAGTMAGALHGRQGIPVRWSTYVHVTVAGIDGGERTHRAQDLVNLAHLLVGLDPVRQSEPEPPFGPRLVHDDGVYAANLDGAAEAPTDHAVVSLCLTEDRFRDHPWRREVYMRDEDGDHNPSLGFALAEAVDAIDAFLAEGRKVVVHCHGGRSRTGFVLKAWWMRRHRATHSEAEAWVRRTWPLYERWTRDFGRHLEEVWEPLVAG